MRLERYYIIVFAIFIVQITLLGTTAKGQLKIGDTLPDILFEQVKRSKSSEFSLQHERVHLYILDFWSLGCGACIASFPHMESLQYRFMDELKIVAVNPWDKNERVTSYFSPSRKKEKRDSANRVWSREYRMTTLPSLNGDTTWLSYFPKQTVPYHVWIDSAGEILAITSSMSATVENIVYYRDTGQLPKMSIIPVINRYDISTHSLVKLWGDDAFSYKRGFMKARGLYQGNGGASGAAGYEELGIVDSLNQTIRYSFVNRSVMDLYKAAWWGLRPAYWRTRFNIMYGDRRFKYYEVPDNRILWQLNDPQFFLRPVKYNGLSRVSPEYPDYDEWSSRARFCVEFEIPLNRRAEAKKIIWEGLNEYFNQTLNISAKIERHKRHSLVLKRSDQYRSLYTHDIGEEPIAVRDTVNNAVQFVDYWFEHIFRDLLPYRFVYLTAARSYQPGSGSAYKSSLNRNLPLFDETGIAGRVDITLYDVPASVNDPVSALNIRLKGTGLHVEKEIREIEMLVISDQVNQ